MAKKAEVVDMSEVAPDKPPVASPKDEILARIAELEKQPNAVNLAEIRRLRHELRGL